MIHHRLMHVSEPFLCSPANPFGFSTWFTNGEELWSRRPAPEVPSLDETAAAGIPVCLHSLCGAWPTRAPGQPGVPGSSAGVNPSDGATFWCDMRGPEWFPQALAAIPGVVEACAKRTRAGTGLFIYTATPGAHALDGTGDTALIASWWSIIAGMGAKRWGRDGEAAVAGPGRRVRDYGRTHCPGVRQGIDGYGKSHPLLHGHYDGKSDLIIEPGFLAVGRENPHWYPPSCWQQTIIDWNGGHAMSERVAALRERTPGVVNIVEFSGGDGTIDAAVWRWAGVEAA